MDSRARTRRRMQTLGPLLREGRKSPKATTPSVPCPRPPALRPAGPKPSKPLPRGPRSDVVPSSRLAAIESSFHSRKPAPEPPQPLPQPHLPITSRGLGSSPPVRQTTGAPPLLRSFGQRARSVDRARCGPGVISRRGRNLAATCTLFCDRWSRSACHDALGSM